MATKIATLYDQAETRTQDTPELAEHSDTILYDWPEGDEHWRWILTAPVAEIVSWAKAIEAEQDDK